MCGCTAIAFSISTIASAYRFSRMAITPRVCSASEDSGSVLLTPRLILLSQPDRAGGRVRFDVADADVPRANPELRGDALALAGEHDAGLAAGVRDDVDVGPGDPATPARAEHLEHCFFGRESTGEVLEISLLIPRAVFLLAARVYALQEPGAVLLY